MKRQHSILSFFPFVLMYFLPCECTAENQTQQSNSTKSITASDKPDLHKEELLSRALIEAQYGMLKQLEEIKLNEEIRELGNKETPRNEFSRRSEIESEIKHARNKINEMEAQYKNCSDRKGYNEYVKEMLQIKEFNWFFDGEKKVYFPIEKCDIPLCRKSEWACKKISIVLSTGESASENIYLANYEAMYRGKAIVTDKKIGVLQININDNKITWLGTVNDGVSPIFFLENKGLIYEVEMHGKILYFASTLFGDTAKRSKNVFASEDLDELVCANYPTDRKIRIPSVDLAWFVSPRFTSAGSWAAHNGKVEIKKVRCEKGTFCLDIENVSYPRRAKVWIDLNKMELVKVKELPITSVLPISKNSDNSLQKGGELTSSSEQADGAF